MKCHIHKCMTLERLLLILNSQILHDITCSYVFVLINCVWDTKLRLNLPISQMLIALVVEQCAPQSHRPLVH